MDEERTGKRGKETTSGHEDRTSRRGRARSGLLSGRRWIWLVGFVVLLALVIVVGGALSSPDLSDDSDLVGVEGEVAESAKFYDDALLALESGETTEAIGLLQKAVDTDPENEAAREKLQQLTDSSGSGSSDGGPDATSDGSDDDDGSDGGADGDGTDGTTDDDDLDDGSDDPDDDDPGDEPSDDSVPVPVVDDVTVLLPAGVEGFRMGSVVADESNAAVPLNPTVESDAYGRVSRVLLSVHDFGDPADAQRFIDQVIKVAYPADAGSVGVDGVDAYFGTDGNRLATVAYTRGRYAFEAVVTASMSTPSSLEDVAVLTARSFPDSW